MATNLAVAELCNGMHYLDPRLRIKDRSRDLNKLFVGEKYTKNFCSQHLKKWKAQEFKTCKKRENFAVWITRELLIENW